METNVSSETQRQTVTPNKNQKMKREKKNRGGSNCDVSLCACLEWGVVSRVIITVHPHAPTQAHMHAERGKQSQNLVVQNERTPSCLHPLEGR